MVCDEKLLFPIKEIQLEDEHPTFPGKGLKSTSSKASKQRQRKEISSLLPVLCTFGEKDKSPLKAAFQLQPTLGMGGLKGTPCGLSTTRGEPTPTKELADTPGQSTAQRGLTLPPVTVADCNSSLSPTKFAVFSQLSRPQGSLLPNPTLSQSIPLF